MLIWSKITPYSPTQTLLVCGKKPLESNRENKEVLIFFNHTLSVIFVPYFYKFTPAFNFLGPGDFQATSSPVLSLQLL